MAKLKPKDTNLLEILKIGIKFSLPKHLVLGVDIERFPKFPGDYRIKILVKKIILVLLHFCRRWRFGDDCASDSLFLVGVVVAVAAVVDVVCIDVREAAVGSGAGLTSQCGRFCPAAGDVIGRRSVIVVNEQCYR